MTEQELEQMEANEEGTHPCPKCGVEVPNERATALKVMTCKDCTIQKSPPKAIYVSNEREGEGGEFIPLDEDAFRVAKRAFAETSDEEEVGEAFSNSEKLKTDD